MARHNASFSCDYVCSICGNVINCCNKVFNNSKKYSKESMYCSDCGKETEFIKLGDRYIVKSDLECYDYCDLDDIEKEVLDLLNMNSETK